MPKNKDKSSAELNLKEKTANRKRKPKLDSYPKHLGKTIEKRYRSVVDNIAIGVSVISPRMEILALNKQMKKWFPEIDISNKPIC